MGLVQQLAGDNAFNRSGRLKGLLAELEPLRSHPAVRRFARLSQRGFRGDIPSQYAVYLSSPPDLREAYPVPEFFLNAAGGRPELDDFLTDLRALARDGRFLEWEAAQGPQRARLLESLRQSVGGTDLEAPLVEYLGARSWDRWIVVASPFFPPGGSSSWILEEKPGLPDVYVILGPRWRSDRPDFGTAARLAEDVWPEAIFSMAYVILELCRPAFFPPRGSCAAAPNDAEDCVEQLWVRAVTERLLRRVFGAGAAKSTRRSQKAFPEFSPMLARLGEYESQRERFKDLVDFADPLTLPFQDPEQRRQCRLVDPARFQDEVYSRRLGFFLTMRLATRPEPWLQEARARLLERQRPAAERARP